MEINGPCTNLTSPGERNPYLSGAGGKAKGAQRGELLRLPDLAEAEHLLTYANGAIKRWDIAPELPNAICLAKYLHSRGIICSQAHSAATAAESLLGFTNGFSHVTHFYNAVTTYHKADQKVLAGIVEAAYLCDHVSIELICDGRHIPKEIVQLALKIKGPCAVSAITDAMRLAGTTEKEGILGNRYSGTPVIVDDDVAKLPDLSSYAGSICTMDRCLRVLCRDYEIPLPIASSLLSYAPAKLLGLHTSLGRIAVGYTADLTLVDSDYRVRHVITDGIVRL